MTPRHSQAFFACMPRAARTGIVLTLLLLGGCAGQPTGQTLPRSGLDSQDEPQPAPQVADSAADTGPAATRSGQPERAPRYTPLQTMAAATQDAPAAPDTALDAFSDQRQVELKAERLPLEAFLHEVFGRLLGVSYTIDQSLQSQLRESVTLNLQQAITERELFRLTRRLLAAQGIDVLGRDGVYFITKSKGRGGLRIGIGDSPADVPESDQDILQIVPVRYGTPGGFQVLLKQLFQVSVNVQQEKQFIFIEGPTENVRRALEMLRLLDAPASRAHEVGVIDLVYLRPEEFMRNIESLLEAEGISLGRGGNHGPVAIVPLERRQAVVVFASERILLERVYHWARQLDVPGETSELQYYLYRPERLRAADMGESLQQLLNLGAGTRAAAPQASGDGEKGAAQAGRSASRATGSGELLMVVDEQRNQLIFHATPAAYDKLRPLLRQLDTAPAQVALEVIVAEVTLTDELQYGVEWYLKKNRYELGTLGSLGIGSSGLNILAIDADVGLDIIANLSRSENLVNILSRPRIVVSDGGSASVNVGTDVPLLTSVASDVSGGELGSTIVQTVQYRSTGVVLNVTATVNGHNVVSLDLSQEISNTSSTTIPGINSPVISQRSFKTSLTVPNGQTAVVGGLISDNNTRGKTAVPGLSSIPLLGNLFKSQSEGRDKTEIIVMITPRIIHNPLEMRELTNQLMHGMESIRPAAPAHE